MTRIRKSEKFVSRKFRFGETTYDCRKELEIPVWLGGLKVYIRTFLVDGDIPWLIGRETMQRLRINLDLESNVARVKELNVAVRLREDSSGHLRVVLGRRLMKNEVWLGVTSGNDLERKGRLKKLHLQFGHPGSEKLIQLLIEAGKGEGNEELSRMRREVKEISEACEVCLRYKKTPPRPVVGFSWSKRFNEAVSMDLGEYGGKRFMVVVDLATRYCQACWVNGKKAEEIIRKFIKHWVALFGTPKVVLSDNGKEFQNESFLRMTEMFGINCKTTAAESPWSNGKCERMVGLIKDTLRKMEEDCDGDLETLLFWAVAAKNSLHNQHGYSPNQLVFGRNTALPDVQGETTVAQLRSHEGEEKLMRENLEAMHKAREAHIRQESDEKLKRALAHNVRVHKFEDVKTSDEVFYKRDGEKEWRGPAKVIGIDGKTIVVKHGGSIREIARVHITRMSGIKSKKEDERTLARTVAPKRDERWELRCENQEEGRISGESSGEDSSDEKD